ncbi:MAG: biotin carboxylase N-terminal domain-containing protein [Microbacteriaceae bacterium]
MQTEPMQTDPKRTEPMQTEPTPAGAGRFGTVLVANRGEIACRVIRTLSAMGIRTVAVYSEADSNAKHVALADLAMCIGPAAPQRSYLDIGSIVAAAVECGADAVHPGYGFLSENAAFAAACQANGLVFIGPGVAALEVMGDKIRAKNHVASHGVPTIAGIAQPGLTDAELIEAATEIGYPLLIKPSAGGGGKGMQTVLQADRLPEALSTARRVAASAFGDDTLFIERLIAAPRHIEVQVLADNYGTVIHLGERECSLQRRHQKVIEEAPSALLDAPTRARIGAAACRAAASVDYRGAGTVEFLVSSDAPDEFFFMEMNTRLQVEHPVTEAVTGIDLVEWQVRIASGERLSITQDDVVLNGHAIEARVYAEDPERGFLPTAGTVVALREPSGDGIRVDSSMIPGLVIGSHYDPMLAKTIAWAPTREQAITRLEAALGDTIILGLKTNIEYLRALLADPDVRSGVMDTTLIERRLPDLAFRQVDDAMLTAAALVLHEDRIDAARWNNPARMPRPGALWRTPNGWRMGSEPCASRYTLAVSATESVQVSVLGGAAAASVQVARNEVPPGAAASGGPGASVAARLRAVAGTRAPGEPLRVVLEINGVARVLNLFRDGDTVWIGEAGFTCSVRLIGRAERVAEQLAGLGRADVALVPDVRSPMPGTVVSVNAATGDLVEVDETLLIVEAMKMEHRLTASIDGLVQINVKTGDLVKLDQIVATITPVAAAPTERPTGNPVPASKGAQ